jgi:hypothetical protein
LIVISDPSDPLDTGFYNLESDSAYDFWSVAVDIDSGITDYSDTITVSTLAEAAPGAFDDTGWVVLYQENFDSAFEVSNGQAIGDDGWLTCQLMNGGTITVANGYAFINTSNFDMAALLHGTAILPDEYKIRAKVGYINYDVTNYEQADLDDTNFNDHGGALECGTYFLTLTDSLCAGDECEEDWWHLRRKLTIDCDGHINSDPPYDTVAKPVYMAYMDPDTNSGGNLLRTWDGSVWDSSAWNWNAAYNYEADTWYYVEIEKLDSLITLRLYDADKNILEEPTAIEFIKINAIEDTMEYLYLGEPHTDDYEGDSRLDEITLLIKAEPPPATEKYMMYLRGE